MNLNEFGIKLKLKVCSLQWYQKLILSKMSLVPYSVGVQHIYIEEFFRTNLWAAKRHSIWLKDTKIDKFTNFAERISTKMHGYI